MKPEALIRVSMITAQSSSAVITLAYPDIARTSIFRVGTSSSLPKLSITISLGCALVAPLRVFVRILKPLL